PPDLALENARSIEPARAGAAHADAGGARMPGDLTGEPTHAEGTRPRPTHRDVAPTDAGFAGPPTHPDLVGAVDCVLSKPGYGTVAECLRRPTPLVYVPRGEFRESPPLVAAIERWLPSAPLAAADLFAGRWSAAIAAALGAS